MEKFKLKLQDKELVVQINDFAEQANGSALVSCGDTMILATCVMAKQERPDLDFFPLTVDYEERYYAAGKIRGPRYIKRESRPSDEAILVSRLIDRSIRPRFPENLKRDVQVVLTCLSWDAKNDPDVIGLVAASLALSISDIPWSGPIGAVRIAKTEEGLILNPDYEQREKSQYDLVLAGMDENGEIMANMLEGAFNESSEDLVLESFNFAKDYIKNICDFQKEIAKKIGKEKIVLPKIEKDSDLEKEINNILKNRLKEAIFQKGKSERVDGISKLKEELLAFVEQNYPQKRNYVLHFFEKEIDRIIHEAALKEEKRADGRKLEEIRKLYFEVGLLPRTHGSGIFFRGQTKSLSILTLGSPGDQQILEGMEIVGKKRFMHHYNFPPYSVGEIRPMRGPGRRDIGHGTLAEKALFPLIPSVEDFPYTIRVVSEVLSSNGSSSMASTTSSSLALMDAGVPIKRPATGISIGLMTEQDFPKNKKYKILADIQGPEDHYGDMDFKVAGTQEGITAIQMDVKIKGITFDILKESLALGKKIRHQILNEMGKILATPRAELSQYAPRIITLKINPEKIREVIGPGGKIINEIIAETGVAIDIDQTGIVFITSESAEAAEKALTRIKNITREIMVGENFEGTVKRLMDFGAFVEILPGQDGLLHISQLTTNRNARIEELINIGDTVPVKVANIDNQGRINLTIAPK